MDPEAYEAFTGALRARLEADPRVLGLVAVGSMARQGTRPDEWSDHDFFVVVVPGAQEELRTRLDWLPDHERVALRFRETVHGVKVVYEHGHMLELAVFDPDELYLARINRYRVLLDRSDIERRMQEIAGATSEATRAEAPDDGYLIGQVLTNVLVAYGRWVRGEKLSARSFLGHAVGHLARLVWRHVPRDAAGGVHDNHDKLDNLDPLRRFEMSNAAVGAALNEVLDRPLPAAAMGLLELAECELAGRVPGFPRAGLEAVRQRISG